MKERIAQAAIQEIRQRGLKFSIREVAGRLGISTKTLYQYFASKEQIVEHIVLQSIEEMKEEERRVLGDPSLRIPAKLRQVLTNLPRGFAFRDIGILKELEQRYPKQWAAIDDYLQNGWDNFRVLVREGIETGDIRPFDIELFIDVYVGGLYRLMDRRAREGRDLSLETALARMVELLLAGIWNHHQPSGEKGEK
ncbi:MULTISPECIES: TetR/AcrR family transcriptional regulator [Cohnella]|uniref:TetR/AcrR family transcriptional regulator n=1 Tax=Cohnella TaxID=329857 RepID=UPI000E3789B1|nr:TetR/AcrR family transcriptional regulator [Cohnella sp.]REK62483.1 MAG: TetR/AcrR family transcriptional regulator [Cohnella sp.]